MEEVPTPEKIEKKPLLEQIGEMTVEELISFFKNNKNLIIHKMGVRMDMENNDKNGKGITPETLRIALRRVVSEDLVPSPGEVERLLLKIKNNKK